jgi:hypothetical protein
MTWSRLAATPVRQPQSRVSLPLQPSAIQGGDFYSICCSFFGSVSCLSSQCYANDHVRQSKPKPGFFVS